MSHNKKLIHCIIHRKKRFLRNLHLKNSVYSNSQEDGLRKRNEMVFKLQDVSFIKLMPKSYFCFFSHFISAVLFFLDHHSAIGLSKTDFSTFLFQPFFFRKQAYNNLLLWRQMSTIWNTIPISFLAISFQHFFLDRHSTIGLSKTPISGPFQLFLLMKQASNRHLITILYGANDNNTIYLELLLYYFLS